MNAAQRRAYWLRFHKFQKTHEAIQTVKIRNALQANVNQYLKNNNLSDVSSSPMYYALVDLYKTTGKIWSAYVQSTLPRKRKARMPMGFSERIVELMRQYFGIDLLNKAEGITDTTKEIIAKILGEASELGLSYAEIVKELKTNSELTAVRARLIARTEMSTAANGSSYINAKETGLDLKKVWIAAQDRRTRILPEDEFDHFHMNGVTIPMNDYFNVPSKDKGIELLLFPGDGKQGASAGNLCNCRCVMGYEVID